MTRTDATTVRRQVVVNAPAGEGIRGIRRAVSRLTIAVDFEGHGIGKVLVPLLVRPQARKEMPANLAALKRRMESQQP
jgi:hypothetical protein